MEAVARAMQTREVAVGFLSFFFFAAVVAIVVSDFLIVAVAIAAAVLLSGFYLSFASAVATMVAASNRMPVFS